MSEEQIGTIERLERQLEWYDRTLEEKQKEITKRDKIIKEVREYIGHTDFVGKGYINFMYELEQILDKENKDVKN